LNQSGGNTGSIIVQGEVCLTCFWSSFCVK